MQTVAVTGASGHLGGNLIRMLIDRGHRVTALARQDTRAMDGLDLTLVQGDVMDPASLRKAFDGADVVHHFAAAITLASHNPKAEEINVVGTRNVIEACRDCGVKRLLHCSSIRALSPRPQGECVDETRPLATSSEFPYDRSKARAEEEILRATEDGLDSVIINPTGVMGPEDYKPSRAGQMFLEIYHGKLPALLKGGFDFVDVRDVCQGAIAAAEKGRTGERYILSGQWHSFKELTQTIAQATGCKPPSIFLPLPLIAMTVPLIAAIAKITHKEPIFTKMSIVTLREHQEISHQKATQELDYNPRPLKQTIEDTFTWFREKGIVQ